jgi:hypothetical protein
LAKYHDARFADYLITVLNVSGNYLKKRQIVYNGKKSGVREIFSRPDAESLPPGLRNGNCLSFCCLPAKTFRVPQKETVAFAYPSGRCPLPFSSTAVFSWSSKKNNLTPDFDEPDN